MTLTKEVKKFALDLGFDDVGITGIEDLPYVAHVKKAYLEGRFGPLDYLYNTVDTRLNLKEAFPEARSVLVVVKNYYTGDHIQANKPKIARYAWGQDYHQWFKKKLRKFRPFLEEKSGAIKFWQFNDTGPFLERAWAHKAGLGFIGKSAMFISRKLGTWTLLGGFATDLELTPDAPYLGPDCGSCTRCIDACPTKAIIAPRKLDANKCISTWTIEKPLHEYAFKLAPRNHEWGFGCDICQEVCPWNKFQEVTVEERFQPKEGRMFLEPSTFAQDLRGSPLHRSSKAGLLANYLRIKNSLKEENYKIINLIRRDYL
jgi:epoxyqueuosine reductase